MSYKIMFVCTGNTCRSPMAEYVMKCLLKRRGYTGIEVSSSGLFANEGRPMSANSVKALEYLHIDYNGEHRARRFTGDMTKEYDLILTVTQDHKDYIPVRLDNLFSIREYVGVSDIGDPYGQDEKAYILSAQAILRAVEKIIEKLESTGVLK